MDHSDTERRLRRLEYLMVRLATVMPELPRDVHESVADIVREIDARGVADEDDR
jgi:hypothetical protein